MGRMARLLGGEPPAAAAAANAAVAAAAAGESAPNAAFDADARVDPSAADSSAEPTAAADAASARRAAAAAAAASDPLAAQLRRLSAKGGCSAAAVDSAVSACGPGDWSPDALHWYLECCVRARVADASRPLATFRRVTESRSLQPSSQSYSQLFRCLAADWRPEHAAAMDQLRAEMLEQQPAVRLVFQSRRKLDALILDMGRHPECAQRLQRWMQEDGMWDSEVVQRSLTVMRRRVETLGGQQAGHEVQAAVAPRHRRRRRSTSQRKPSGCTVSAFSAASF